VIARQPESWIYRAVDPDWRWGIAEHIAAIQADNLNTLVWAKTKDAARGKNAPKPIPRPHAPSKSVSEDLTPEEIEEILARPRTEVTDTETI
jgi:hypothetical protein